MQVLAPLPGPGGIWGVLSPGADLELRTEVTYKAASQTPVFSRDYPSTFCSFNALFRARPETLPLTRAAAQPGLCSRGFSPPPPPQPGSRSRPGRVSRGRGGGGLPRPGGVSGVRGSLPKPGAASAAAGASPTGRVGPRAARARGGPTPTQLRPRSGNRPAAALLRARPLRSAGKTRSNSSR